MMKLVNEIALGIAWGKKILCNKKVEFFMKTCALFYDQFAVLLTYAWIQCHSGKMGVNNLAFCFKNCSDILWEKNVEVIVKNFCNSRLKVENLQTLWDHTNNLFEQRKVSTIFKTECFFKVVPEGFSDLIHLNN